MWNHTRDDYIAEQYVECPVCGHPTDPEDLKICTDCGREICRNANCGGVCGYSDESTTCDEYVCAECQDENGYCARCAAEPHINMATEGHELNRRVPQTRSERSCVSFYQLL